MKVAFFSTQPYDRLFFEQYNKVNDFILEFYEAPLDEQTVTLAQGSEAVCVFVNDHVNKKVIEQLAAHNTKIIALRCAGFNNVDLQEAMARTIKVVRVPAYSPYAVAEHAVAMIMTLNRKTHKAYNRIREQNFSLQGLLGFDVFGKTVGVIGTGNIGKIFCKIMIGFGCKVVAFDLKKDDELINAGVRYCSLQQLLPESDIVSLHCPLTKDTYHLVNNDAIAMMKKGVMLINTSRGGLIDTKIVIEALKSGHIGSLGIDVYEQEENLFFHDLSDTVLEDDVIARLTAFSNVLITSHQGFFTQEALTQIATTTLMNLRAFVKGEPLVNEVRYP